MENFIKEAFNLFEDIGGTASRLEKEGYLRQGVDNPVFKELLYRCYNSFMMFNIKKIPDYVGKFSANNIDRDMNIDGDMYDTFLELLNDLNTRSVTGNAATEEVERFLCHWCSKWEYKWYSKVLQKDLKIGITEKTINGVFGKDFIPTYSCMLSHPLTKYPKRFVIDAKMDGNRMNGFVYADGSVACLSRNGLPIEGYTEIEAELATLPRGFMYDGEIMDKSGNFNETQKQVRKKGVKGKEGDLHIFDMVSIEEFNAGKGTTKYERRLAALDVLFSAHSHDSLVRMKPSRVLYANKPDDIEFVQNMHMDFLTLGYEGTMIKDLDAVYECKKGRAIQKLKDSYTIDLMVVDVEEGKAGTILEGTLGALVVELSHTDILEQLPVEQHLHKKEGTFRVNVGGGYSHQLRDQFWATKNDLINRTIEVKFWNVSTNEKDEHSLRFPNFVKLRTDK